MRSHPVTSMFSDIRALYDRADAVDAAREARTEVELLRMDVERLLIISEALWRMLREKGGYTDEDLVNRMAEIDLRDGALDGKVAKGPPAQCPTPGSINRRTSLRAEASRA